MFSKFKNKQQQHIPFNQITPPKQLQSSDFQTQSPVPMLTTSKESMFKGTLKVKTPLQTQSQQQSNQLDINQHPSSQTTHLVLSINDSAHNSITHFIQSPLNQNNIDSNVDIKYDDALIKKKASGFSFLQKSKQEASQSTDESTQDQNESFIAYGINTPQNSTQLYPQDQIVFTFQTQLSTQQQLNEQYKQEISQQQIHADHSTIQLQKNNVISDSQNYYNEIQMINNQFQNQIDDSHLQQYQLLTKELFCFYQEQNQKLIEIILQQQKIESQISFNYKALNEFHNRITKLSVEQSQSEQFDASLQTELIQIQQQIIQIEDQIKVYQMLYDNHQNQKSKLKLDEQIYYQSIEANLDKIEKLHITYIDHQQQESISTLKKIQQVVDEENERIKIQQIHLDIDYKHLDDEEQHLNQIMDNQTKEYRISYNLLLQQKQNLESQITELQFQLNQKKQELLLTDSNLISTKDSIQQIQQKFHQQIGKVQNKREKLNDELNSINLERTQIENLENESMRRQQEYQFKLKNLQDDLIIIKEKKSNLLENAYYILTQFKQEMDVFSRFQQSQKYSLEALQQLNQVQRQIDGLNYQRSISQQQLHEILNKKSELQIKLPKMIDSKAHNVQNKNFKGAAQINEQIKEVQKQIILYENNISQNQSKESQLLQSIDDIENTLLMKKQQFNQINQITEILRYQYQELKLKQILQINYQGQSTIIQDIKDELNLLFNKYQQFLDESKAQPQDYFQHKQNIPMIQFEQRYPENFKQNSKQEEKDVNHTKKIVNQDIIFSEIQEEIEMLKKKAFQYAQADQFQEADKLQQQINLYQNEVLKSIDFVKIKYDLGLQETTN